MVSSALQSGVGINKEAYKQIVSQNKKDDGSLDQDGVNSALLKHM